MISIYHPFWCSWKSKNRIKLGDLPSRNRHGSGSYTTNGTIGMGMNIYLCLAELFLLFWLFTNMGMDQCLLIAFLGGWTSIYQLFWCSPGVQGFDTLPHTRDLIIATSRQNHIISHHSGSSSKCTECLGSSDSSKLVMLSLKSLNAKKTSPLAQVGLIWSQLLKGAKRGLRFASFRITISCSLKLLRVFRDNDDYSQWI